MLTIPLDDNQCAVIDDEDAEKVMQYRWRLFKRPHTYYAVTDLRENNIRTFLPLHTLILDIAPPLEADHKDRNGLNCVRSNLRIATKSQNLANRVMPQGPKGSGYRGVSQKGSRYYTKISVNKQIIRLGGFTDPVAAAVAYDVAAKEYYGDFAMLNFPA